MDAQSGFSVLRRPERVLAARVFFLSACVMGMACVATPLWAQPAQTASDATSGKAPDRAVGQADGPSAASTGGATMTGASRTKDASNMNDASTTKEATTTQGTSSREEGTEKTASPSGTAQSRNESAQPRSPVNAREAPLGPAQPGEVRRPPRSGWGRVGMGLWFLSSPPKVWGGQVAFSVEGGRRPWLGGRAFLAAAVLPLPNDTLDEMSSFESMTVGVFGVGPVLRLSGLPSVARALRRVHGLDLEAALLVSFLANRPFAAVATELEFDVRYLFPCGWWVGGAVKVGWWHVMTEALDGDFSLGPAVGAGVEVGRGW